MTKFDIEEKDVLISKATKADADDIFDLACQFFSQSNFKYKTTLNPSAWFKTITDNIEHPLASGILARDSKTNDLIGYVLIYCQNDFTVEKIGEMYQFYVAEGFRRSYVSRMLLDKAMETYKEWGCVRCYAEASPGMTDEYHLKKFENLWKKYGYNPTGVTMMKEF